MQLKTTKYYVSPIKLENIKSYVNTAKYVAIEKKLKKKPHKL